MARRPRSLALFFKETDTADGPIMRTEVLAALIEADIPKEQVEGIEAPRKNKYFVVFKRFTDKRHNTRKKIKIRENYFTLEHPDPRPAQTRKSKVKIFYYPLDEDINQLEKVLQHYGTFTAGSMRDLEDRNCGIKNGIKELFMHVNKAIPSYLHVGKNMIRVEYFGQTATCRKCHKAGHIARECEAEITCRKCGGDDHAPAECPNVICFHCGKQGHTSNSCFQYEQEFPDLTQHNKEDNPFGNFNPSGEWNEPDNHDKPNEEEKIEDNPTDANELEITTATATTTEKEKEEEKNPKEPKDSTTEGKENADIPNETPDSNVDGNKEEHQGEEHKTEGKQQTDETDNKDSNGKTNAENKEPEEESTQAKETETETKTETEGDNTTENITDQDGSVTTPNGNKECDFETITVLDTENSTEDETDSEIEGDENDKTPQTGKRKRNNQKSKPEKKTITSAPKQDTKVSEAKNRTVMNPPSKPTQPKSRSRSRSASRSTLKD